MAEIEARVRIVTVGQEQVRAALAGTTAAARASGSDQRSMTRAAEQETKRSIDAERRARESAMGAAARAYQDQLDRVRQLARAMEAEGETSARAWAQAWDRAFRDRARAEETYGGGGGAAGGGGLGGLGTAGLTIFGAGAALAGRALSVARVRSLDERASGAIDFQRVLTSLGASTGIEEGRLQETLLRGTVGTGRLPADVANAFSQASDLYGPEVTAGLLDNVEALGDVSIATNTTLEDTITLIGQLASSFRVGREGVRELIGSVSQLGANGRVPIGALANMADAFAASAAASGRTGTGAAVESVAIVEALGARLGPGGAGSALRGLFEQLTLNPDVERRLRSAGVRIREPGSDELRPLSEILQEIGENPRLDPTTRSGRNRLARIFGTSGRSPAARAVSALRDDPSAALDLLAGLDPDAGLRTVNEIAGSYRGTAEGRFAAIGARSEAATIRDADRILGGLEPATALAGEIRDQFPLLTAAMGSLTTALQALYPLIGGSIAGGVGRQIIGGAAGAALGGGGALAAGGAGGWAIGALGFGSAAAGVAGLAIAATVYQDAQEAARVAEIDRVFEAAIRGGDVDAARVAGEARMGRVAVLSGGGGAVAPGSLGGIGPTVVRLDPSTVSELAAAIGPGPAPAGSGTLTAPPTPAAGRRGAP